MTAQNRTLEISNYAMTDKTQYSQDSSASTLTKEEKARAYNKAYREANIDKIKAWRKDHWKNNKEKIRAYNDANKDRIKAQRKAYREANKDKVKAQQKVYAEANKEKLKEYNKSYHEANKDKHTEYKRVHYHTNKEEYRNRSKKYQQNNKERIKERRKAHYEEIKTNPSLALQAAKSKLRVAVYNAFKRIRKNKPTDTQALLGCSWEEAKSHMESLFKEGMSWQNHGEWHIDHIRPVSSFTEDDLDLMNHISNLQPLWASENLEKSNL